jgi:hypothetical protein
MKQTCNVCLTPKDLEEFGTFTTYKKNIYGEPYAYMYRRLNCKECHRASTKLSVLKRQMRIKTMLRAFQPTTTTL